MNDIRNKRVLVPGARSGVVFKAAAQLAEKIGKGWKSAKEVV